MKKSLEIKGINIRLPNPPKVLYGSLPLSTDRVPYLSPLYNMDNASATCSCCEPAYGQGHHQINEQTADTARAASAAGETTL